MFNAHGLTSLQKVPFLEKQYIKNIPASDNVSLPRIPGALQSLTLYIAVLNCFIGRLWLVTLWSWVEEGVSALGVREVCKRESAL